MKFVNSVDLADIHVTEKSLRGAHFSPGVTDRWTGWPHRIPD